MAIHITSKEVPISTGRAREIIQSSIDKMGIFIDIDRCSELIGIFKLIMRKTDLEAQNFVNDKSFTFSSKDRVVEQLIHAGIDASMLRTNKGANAFSAQIRTELLNDPDTPEDAVHLIKLSEKYAAAYTRCNTLSSYMYLNRCIGVSKNKHRMSLVRPQWSILNTGRIQTSNPNIQGIPRDCADIITEPPGYTLVRADSGQIEPRINFSTFLRDELIMNLIQYYNDAYRGLLHYCLMSDEELEACRSNFEMNFRPVEDNDDFKTRRQMIKRLTNAGSYGCSNLENIDSRLASAFEHRIQKHPARIAREREVVQQVNRGDTTFYGYFGTPVVPGETAKYDPASDGWKNHVIRCGINNPVQTTASELMLFSVNEANKILSEAEDSYICFYKHDEACFLVSDKDAANGFIERLGGVTAYNVDGWIPIDSDILVGVKEPTYPTYL